MPVAVSATYIISGPFTFKVEPQIECVHAGSGTHSTGGFMVNKCTWIINEVEWEGGWGGPGSCFRSRGVLRCEPCRRQAKSEKGWRVWLSMTPLMSAEDTISCQMLDRCCVKGGRNGKKKIRVKTANLNLDQIAVAAHVNFQSRALLDCPLADLTALNWVQTLFFGLVWKLQHKLGPDISLKSCFCAQGW